MNVGKELAGSSLACVTLTPSIKQAMAAMSGSEVLRVFSDDPAAPEGVPAWCRPTGNKLVDIEELNSFDTLFYIQKKTT